MSHVAIRAEGLGKRYDLGKRAAQGSTSLRAGLSVRAEEFWALRDLSFEIEAGHVVGVIGNNGAGKTTLLKILSRISEPTAGWAEIHGRVGSLLEVGTGFHPELSGRENIYLNGAIIGMKREDIRKRFDEIVAFAGVDEFLDTPIKRYSTGMHMRLAFSVAAHLEPDILIVDEVLAVGDAEFQKKCLGKLEAVAARSHRTVLFVSHNLQAVQSLCNLAMHLEGGRMVALGETRAVVGQYMSRGSAARSAREWHTDAPGEAGVHLRRVAVSAGGHEGGVFPSSQAVEIDLWVETGEARALSVGFALSSAEGAGVFESYQTDGESRGAGAAPAGSRRWRCVIPAGLLNAGVYLLSPGLRTNRTGPWSITTRPSVSK